ncbi:hypothetical protein TVAG_044260 [Trichomonas vaginalis G3]|uniref:DUF4200 domain-containing protein n=1 Tax=Trichomonas vaginalis (strain ATCC PRA-98 / G3) TaxID=412133 RepID=A2E0I4_TRIV3|nr:DUF4200 domain family [Trichomonas vaginalis G3]EAY13864.1 hypothetical protein TVAG_044260 [Trichomonas vaginalis G3]KAI5520434.1 DUF4200 domain family [Trichomonas vaginalis G3]|eukprot:XP_001326087.1 hypothetical protein [Trichomonas vaginalis G3]
MRHSLNLTELRRKEASRLSEVPKFARQRSTPELQAKKHELDHCRESLDAAKVNYENWKVEFTKKVDNLNEKKQKFQEQEANLKNFLKVYQHELEKAEQRKVEEEAKYKNICKQLEDIKNEIKLQIEERNQLREEADKLQKYTDIMQEAVVVSQHFNTVDDLINQFHRIIDTRQDCLQKFQSLLSYANKQQQEHAIEQQLEDTYVMDANNKYYKALDRLDKALQRRRNRKEFIFKKQQTNLDTEMEVAKIKSALSSIYSLIMNDLGLDVAEHPATPEQMIQTIKSQILDLNEIIRSCNAPSSRRMAP